MGQPTDVILRSKIVKAKIPRLARILTGNTFRGPMLCSDPFVRGVHDLFLGDSTIEYTIFGAGRLTCNEGL